ncbi:MAG: hypothetical protein E3K37_04280 [Candidatus Kuenenia sp.]|nr:hypothetical protein [Candidatus Kuenenia hertensis]
MKKLISYCTISATAIFGLYFIQPSFTATANDVNQIYKDTCELCHGPDGKGTEAGKQFGVPNFADPDYQRSRTDEQMKESMTKGTKNPNYVPLGDLGVDLSHLDALVQIVRGFGG